MILPEPLASAFGPRARPEEPMAHHTTLRIGGPAALYVEVASASELGGLSQWARGAGRELVVMGKGSNLIVPDEGTRAIVASTYPRMSGVEREGEADIRAQAGATLGRLARFALEWGLGGTERLASIPGTVGGALAMNAGTPEGSIGDVTRSVTALTPEGAVQELKAKDLDFSYRTSAIRPRGLAAVEAVFELEPCEPAEIRDRIERDLERRKASTPWGEPSAGSVFVNPPGDAAGRLIDAAGLKGLTVGGAQVSQRHANFIVNRGGATASDVLALIGKVRSEVLKQTGVELELEVKVLGS
jgi:UDP-N-acetylmuramate dehydrogenase